MKRALSLVIAFFALWMGVALALAQTPNETPDFMLIQQIGEPRPQGIQYEPQLDRFAWVDGQGRLLLVDAATYLPQHMLYESGAYNAYRFSHDGRWLALAIDRRVELWNTASGERAAVFEPPGANLVQGPLQFTPDDRYLLLDTVVPAPQELRRSENDTSIIPWLWDLEAGRGERASRYPSLEDGYAFFEYRNGLVVGNDNLLIGGIPNRLMLIDGSETSFPTIGEIPANRFERDPITVWRSATDTMLYTDPGTGRIIQIDTEGGTQFDLPIGIDLNYRYLTDVAEIHVAQDARILCPDAGGIETSLLRLIYGENYLSFQNFDPQTFMLLDVLQPLTMGQERGALLIYAFNERRGRGVIELIRPQDAQQMLLNPDGTRLMIRRASGEQNIEIYDLQTCTRDLTITPAEPNGTGVNTLAFNRDGSVIISDFQRFDAWSGEVLAHEVQYTRPFESLTFGEDGRSIVTGRGTERIWWDIESGRPQERVNMSLLGNVEVIVDTSGDTARYLTQRSRGDGGLIAEIIDIRQNTRRTLEIAPLAGSSASLMAASPSWESVLVRYTAADGFNTAAIAVYTFGRGQVLFAADIDLPFNSQQFGWLDERTIYVAGDRSGSAQQPIYGVEYAPSGIPACFADAFPSQVDSFSLLWEAIRLRSNAESLNRLAMRLCSALPDTPDAAIAALTPTPSFFYNSDPTPLPYAIPGVPICITQRFPFEAVRYAELWRDISAGASPEQLTELEAMICEGLIGSVSGIAATPTINPNLNVPPTPTPIDAAPQTTGGGFEFRPLVIAIDIETGARAQGDILPPQPVGRDLNMLLMMFSRQFNRAPNVFALSPDGRLAAEIDPNGFVRIYAMAQSYDDVVRGAASAQATLQGGVRSIGLVPTATAGFSAIGDIRPTLTPTMIPPTPMLSEVSLPGWNPTVTDVCPSRQLYTLDNLPPDYAASGRLLTTSSRGEGALWVIEPAGGRSYSDASIPPCGVGVECGYSLDGAWIVRQMDDLIVSRPDGSGAMTVISAGDMRISPSTQWLPNNTLLITYNDFLPTAFPGQSSVQRIFDPATGRLSEPLAPLDLTHPVRIGELPIVGISPQPGGMLAVVATPDGIGSNKYWIYDRETGAAEYFASGFNNPSWDILGRYLEYQSGATLYRYDVATRAHYRLESRIPGIWSPDWTRRVNLAFDWNDANMRIAGGELPLKLQIQDDSTGAITRYCVPETGMDSPNSELVWSPDGRYLAFTYRLPINGDFFPTPGPTLVPYTSAPTQTPIPLETQYDSQFLRTLILDTQTGYVTVVGQDADVILRWIEGGE